MVNCNEYSTVLFGKEIKAVVVETDHGINVTVAGGDKSHIGAVCIIDGDGNMQSITFPTHKETIIAENWAKLLYEEYRQPVTVSAGIHFDVITKEQIMEVVEVSKQLLEKILQNVRL